LYHIAKFFLHYFYVAFHKERKSCTSCTDHWLPGGYKAFWPNFPALRTDRTCTAWYLPL